MTPLISIVPVQRDERAPGCDRPVRPVRRLRREVLAAARQKSDERATRSSDDPWLESWRKLLAKYRRR
jgi:hypothetical protein